MRSFALLLCVVALITDVTAGAPEYRAMGPDIFDPTAPAEKLIADALTSAKREDKRVVLLFGANWCPWCRRLHVALTKEPAVQTRLREKFVLVYIDANTRNDKTRNAAVLEKYGNPVQQFGLPAIAVLERDGTQLTTRETATLAAGTEAKVAANVLAFLNEWAK